MDLQPIIRMAVHKGHAEEVSIKERNTPIKTVGRKAAQRLLFENAVAGNSIHTDEQPTNGVIGILIFDKQELEHAKLSVNARLIVDEPTCESCPETKGLVEVVGPTRNWYECPTCAAISKE